MRIGSHGLWECLQHGKQAYGRPVLAQIVEALRLRLGHQKLGIEEYFRYNLSDARRRTFQDKTRFVGWRVSNAIEKAAIAKDWWAVVEDKAILYSLLHDLGLPIPRIEAFCHPYRRFAGAERLATHEDTVGFLRDPSCYPLFGKPNSTGRAVGLHALTGFDEATDSVVLFDGSKREVGEFASEVCEYPGGYLFQEMLQPHPELDPISNGRFSTTRIIVLMRETGPEPVCGLFRIAVGKNVGDHRRLAGNMIGGVDIATGRVNRMIVGVGPDLRRVDRHPETGVPLDDLRLPEWDRVLETVEACARVVPGVRYQGWDIGLSDRGPVAVEANAGSGVNSLQVSNDTGLLDDRFQDFLKEFELSY